MTDQSKTKQVLIQELVSLRKRIAELEQAESEHKQVEEALQEREAKYRTILKTMEDGYFEQDLAGNFIFLNNSMSRIYGYPTGELMGMNYKQHTDLENGKKCFHAYVNIYKTGQPGKVVDFEIIRKDGTKRHIESSVSLIRDAAGNPIAFRGIVRDITERKKVEGALRESEKKYHNILESIQEGYFELDLAGNYTFVNEANCRFLGYTKEELVGMNYRQHTDDESSKKLYQPYRELYRTGKPIEILEVESFRKDGTKVIYGTSVSLIRDSEGKPIGFRGVSRNITERKQVEEALRESEKKYRLLADNIQDVIFVMDMNLNYTYLSPSVKLLSGYEPEEIMKHTLAETMTPSSADFALSVLSEIMELEKSVHRDINISRTFQLEMNRKDGTTVWVETKAFFMRDENLKPIGIMGITRDITERKKAEETLRKNEDLYRTLVENASDIVFRLDNTGHITFVNPAALRIMGYEEKEIIGRHYATFIRSDMQEQAMKFFGRQFVKVIPNTYSEYPVIVKGGREIWLGQNTQLICQNDKVVAFQAVAREITERKLIGDALQDSENRYRELSIIDDLTQLYNSRHFYDQLKIELDRSNRYEQSLTLLLLDLDNFKSFNDAYGHIEGDQVLRRLGQVVKRCLRQADLAFRYGGEEFTVLLPMTTSENGVVTAERIRTEFKKESFFPAQGKDVHLTVSIGLAQYQPQEEMKTFVHRVDQLMYQGKKNGKDRVCCES